MDRLKKALKEYFPLYLKGWVILTVTLMAAAVLCAALSRVTSSDTHVPLIFVLAVLIVSLLTDGYLYGIMAALLSVVGVNFAFTYPYMKLNFTIYGYPLTFMTMLAVGLAVSALTTRVKAQEKLRAESEREKMRANLLRAISHDLRTPLTGISGAISTALENDGTLTRQQEQELLRDARQEAEWLKSMVENLLSITRISGNEAAQLHKDVEIMEEVLSEAVQTFRKHYPKVEISVTVPEIPQLVPMDAMLIEQVLINLLDNAAIHGRNTTKVEIESRTVDGCAVISLTDNGGGIPKEILIRLFDGSLQLGGGSGDRSRSMGIGLSVCRTIVEAHDGSICAENTDTGARFAFRLPLEEGDYTYGDQG